MSKKKTLFCIKIKVFVEFLLSAYVMSDFRNCFIIHISLKCDSAFDISVRIINDYSS
jgi:hypothetical protein